MTPPKPESATPIDQHRQEVAKSWANSCLEGLRANCKELKCDDYYLSWDNAKAVIKDYITSALSEYSAQVELANAELENELGELRKDRERLDWLTSHANFELGFIDNLPVIGVGRPFLHSFHPPLLRTTIDTAIARESLAKPES